MPVTESPLLALLVAVPETAGSTLYGMIDVLAACGSVWNMLVGGEENHQLIVPRIVSPLNQGFRCLNGVPVTPDFFVDDDPEADIVILPNLWLGPRENIKGRYPELMDWIRRRHRAGASIYSACTGAIMLAETGLLNGHEATSHWAFSDMFEKQFPGIKFQPESNLKFADPAGRIVTAGGSTSWHDLVIHIISRHCSPGEALRIAKVFLLKWHGEGQLPYASLVYRNPHADSAVRICEDHLARVFREPNAVSLVVDASAIPERTLKRRFKAATGATLIEYVQNLRIEEAKRSLEQGSAGIDDISVEIGYEEPAFFRRLFKRRTGMTPSQYRRLFQPIARQPDRLSEDVT